MRTNDWLRCTALLAALQLCGLDAFAQAHPPARHTTAAPHHGAPTHASPAPAASAAPTTCETGEQLDHGHCCITGAEWVAAQRRCVNHNRRQGLVQVAITAPEHQTLPSDLSVTLDGTAMQGSPPSASVAPGRHVLQVAGTGVRTAQQDLTLTAGQAQRVPVQLESTVGRIQVNVSTPGAQVLVDDHAIAGLPPVAEGLAPGSHHVHIVAPDHLPFDRDVTVAAGQTATVDAGELAMPSAPPPTPVVASPAVPPPPQQTLVVEVMRPGQHFDVEVQSGTNTYHCDAEATHDAPCSLHDVPPGPAHVTVHGTTTLASDVRVPVGTSTLEIDFQPTPAMQGVYIALGVAMFIPAVAGYTAAATCHGENCDGLWYLAVGLTFIPGLLPGVFFLASGARTQGNGHVTIRSPEQQAARASGRYWSESMVATPLSPAAIHF